MNEDKLSERLYQEGKLRDFVNFAMGQKPDLKRFLDSNRLLNFSFVESAASYFTLCPRGISGRLRTFVRDAFARPYIPGSSIKGALRVSIMYVILKRMKENVRKSMLDRFVQRKIGEYRRDRRGRAGFGWFKERFKKKFAEELERKIFKDFVLRGRREGDAHHDILRYLKVSDSSFLDRNSLVVEEVKVLSVGRGRDFRGGSIFVECVPAGKEFEFEIKMDREILDNFMKENPHLSYDFDKDKLYDILLHPLEAAKEKAQDLLEEEKNFFKENTLIRGVLEFEREKPNFRLGWGQGLLGASIDLLLTMEIRQNLRNTLFRDCGNTPAPKTRRLVVDGKNQTFGWCVIES
ncbi:type III-A CRISPR-associated RAMP protein Csm5 [Candidatus Aerophobetes bacterium]|nr:type III-A CRISPR-associated RAMP protein Csm5 [Candidatus Aerophobetes bacterium]